MNIRQIEGEIQGTFLYVPYFFQSGSYDVFIWHPASKDYESDVKVRLFTADGEDEVTLNQQKKGGQWKKIGRYDFEKGRQKALSIETSGGDNLIVADAVKFVLIE
jgi:hypothetical protein